eukprot:1947109-Rhodomonas_salina.1
MQARIKRAQINCRQSARLAVSRIYLVPRVPPRTASAGLPTGLLRSGLPAVDDFFGARPAAVAAASLRFRLA